MQVHVASEAVTMGKSCDPLFQRIWPPAFLASALGLTVAWVSFLGYELVSLIIS